MNVRVHKYGGTSLGDATQLGKVADRVVATARRRGPLVVVVSAMGSTTDDLLRLAASIAPEPDGRELDVLLSTGECVSAALVALAIRRRGAAACSLTGAEAGLVTDCRFGRARIVGVQPDRVRSALAAGNIVVVAGFQGRAESSGDTTTLGRGGSDATATALAAALRADVCEVGTDVDGVYTADPRWVPAARKLDHVSYSHMLDLARGGASVLMPRCVEYAMVHQVPLQVRLATGDEPGSWIGPYRPGRGPEGFAERAVVAGVAHLPGQACYTVPGLRDDPAVFAVVFTALTEAGVLPDLTDRTPSAEDPGRADLSFVMSEEDTRRADAVLEGMSRSYGVNRVRRSEKVGKLSVVGTRLRSDPAIAATLLHALSAAEVTAYRTELGAERIAVLCPEEQLIPGLVAVHDAFALSGHLAGTAGDRVAELVVAQRVEALS